MPKLTDLLVHLHVHAIVPPRSASENGTMWVSESTPSSALSRILGAHPTFEWGRKEPAAIPQPRPTGRVLFLLLMNKLQEHSNYPWPSISPGCGSRTPTHVIVSSYLPRHEVRVQVRIAMDLWLALPMLRGAFSVEKYQRKNSEKG